MSHLFGPVFQIAYVVEDVDAAIDHMVKTMGVGPFFLFPLPLQAEWLEVRGERVPADYDLLAAAALSYSGETMIELIQPGSAPSTYREFLDAGRRGVHHLGTVATDYDAQMAAARAAGIGVAAEGVLPISRFAYLDTDVLFPGTMVELIEMTQAMRDLFDGIKATANAWDGREPVRRI
ncbi:VOC family protein [Sphingomonas flavalba]|uniref:VOC family protein n=1 Tax=Sphingomonas flavalba TaxID=2559804 RepID=UPI00109DA6C3|nr:VOC family protein [Sphingomonas flavalba]